MMLFHALDRFRQAHPNFLLWGFCYGAGGFDYFASVEAMRKGGQTMLLEAVEAGLIQKGDGGYDIGPFLRFWDAFSKYLPFKGEERPNEMGDLLEMLNS